MSKDVDPAAYREMLEQANLGDAERQLLLELIYQFEQVSAENDRLRKALLRVSSQNRSRMSTKLKEALYE